MIVRLCDECQRQTHSCVEIKLEDAFVKMRDIDTGELTKGRVRERKKRGDIKRRFWEIDLCVDHWPEEGVYPPQISGNPENVFIEWNADKLDLPS